MMISALRFVVRIALGTGIICSLLASWPLGA